MTTKPEIRINFSYLLYVTSVKLDKLYNPDAPKLVSTEQCEEWTKAYKKEWRKHEAKILDALNQILGLEFYRDVIDVSLAPYITPQSDPLIIHFGNKPDQFVDVLAHELIHVLLTDNNVLQINSNSTEVDLIKEWANLFGEFEFKTLIHIPVHAILKALFIDYMKEESRYVRDKEHANTINGGKSYVEAWEYVDSNGYEEIIEKLKDSYRKIDM